MSDEKRALSDQSTEMLKAIQKLHDLEKQKRDVDISSPWFHRLAKQITEQSRRVFRMAGAEEGLGDRTETGEDSINDVDPRSPAGNE